MKKFKELIQDRKFSKSLMNDKEFVAEAKEIFRSENIEIEDEKLKQMLDEIESKLAKSKTLEDEVLEHVSGGVTKKDAARKAITSVTAITGAVIGTALMRAGGIVAARNIIPEKRPFNIKEEYYGSGYDLEDSLYNTSRVNIIKSSAVAGGASGFMVGAGIGYKFGQFICRKVGLE